ncbi:HAMP domain-containing methyl-accepting chemotaxis protein [Bdellovibrio bacteriovorus]|uniref:Chemotaxis protein n=1 Tax=Bdellovibrio bacteriovorus TaxID=959 RepID=A0A1Z3NCR3_BDEBC|nr:methyl-accepting chemotaxis protein [Bdellovibrio bacteriovorus]ASD65269.1 chemotaxis protein [Bdellovibrio bacteriovorus]
MNQLSLKGRFLMVTGLLMAIALITNLLSLDRLRFQNKVTGEIGEVWLPAVSKAADLNINLANYRKLEFNLLATQSTDERKQILDEMDSLLGNITIYSKVLDPLLTTDDLRKTYEEFLAGWEAYQEESEKFKGAVDQENEKLAEEILQGTSNTQYTKAYDSLKKLTDDSYMAGVSNAENVAKNFKLTIYVLSSVVGVSLLLGLFVSFWNIRKVQRSLNMVAGGLDESSSTIRNRATELVSSSDQISSSSTSTAASLEEIVASMEELTATVRQNSLNSNQAANISVEGQRTVDEGQKKLERLVQVISEISNNSKKIEEILTMIDDIAFQTNLLALNAAVEAARAGEQGKGFAVVADAVRALAQKSAGAAKEISVLIHEASEKSKQGVSLAADSDTALKAIVQNTRTVSELIQTVAQGSHEQSQGIEQVNKALTQIDQSLQGVASSMGAVTGSTEDMQTQSEELHKMMCELHILVGHKENKNKENETKHGHEEIESAI